MAPMPGFPARHSLLVLLPVLAFGCPDPVEPSQDETGATTDADGSSGAPTTVSTSTSTTSAGPGSVTITTVTATTDGDPTATDSVSVSVSVSVSATDGPDTDDMPPFCEQAGGGALEVGEACTASDQCFSGVCPLYTDAPLDLTAVCADSPANCSMRVTATAVDIVTRQTPADIDVVITSALQAATNPVGATPLDGAVTDAAGRIDLVMSDPPNEPISLIALLSGPSYVLTATGLAAPLDGTTTYGLANDAHDLWLVSVNAVNAWSNMLSLDPTIPSDLLPLVEAGGVVGLVRDANGLPLAGATVTSTEAGSGAIIRYLVNDGTFNTAATGDLGLFIVLDPALAEVFEAELAGMPLGEGTAGTAEGAVFTLVFTAP